MPPIMWKVIQISSFAMVFTFKFFFQTIYNKIIWYVLFVLSRVFWLKNNKKIKNANIFYSKVVFVMMLIKVLRGLGRAFNRKLNLIKTFLYNVIKLFLFNCLINWLILYNYEFNERIVWRNKMGHDHLLEIRLLEKSARHDFIIARHHSSNNYFSCQLLESS